MLYRTRASRGRSVFVAASLRNQAKKGKDWETSDLIRNELTKLGIQLKDSKDGTKWSK